ncbi:hypothetical protein JKP88DRAFT_335551 [Tribonema minus]|uniref:Uncharacterized protein n=1 Tax=Tribonema minus TaxID=303371 RepID=A0A835YJQ9_9STRA|nr:hypothetical protein JKP88DRAFT_335551 [Tribonema minus]
MLARVARRSVAMTHIACMRNLSTSAVRAFEDAPVPDSVPDGNAGLPPQLYMFGTHNEDAEVEMHALDIVAASRRAAAAAAAAAPSLRVMSIAASGTHALAMCSNSLVKSIDAVDMNPNQILLSKLTAAAAAGLASADDLAAFLGNAAVGDGNAHVCACHGALANAQCAAALNPAVPTDLLSGGDADARAAAYAQRVRRHLDAEAAAFWDANAATVRAGTMRCGAMERFYVVLRAYMARFGASPEGLRSAVHATYGAPAMWNNASPEGLRRAVHATYGATATWNKYMPAMPEHATQRLVEGLPPVASAGLIEAMAAAQAVPPRANLVLHTLLHGTYPMDSDAHRPVFLRKERFAAARAHGTLSPRLNFHVGPIQEVGPRLAAALRSGSGSTAAAAGYDLITISNILDMLDDVAAAKPVVQAIASCLAPGGALLCRWTGSHARPGFVSEVFRACGLKVDDAVDARLMALETSFYMPEVTLGVRRQQ